MKWLPSWSAAVRWMAPCQTDLAYRLELNWEGKLFRLCYERTNERTRCLGIYILACVCAEGSRSPGWWARRWMKYVDWIQRQMCRIHQTHKEIQYPLSRPLAGEKQCLSLCVSCVSYVSLSFCVVYMHDSRRGTWKRSRRRRRRSWCSLLLSTPFFSLRMTGIWVVIMQDPSRTKMNAFCFARDIWAVHW